jgi:NodT family efflux transporter outer membrane factor (OMF) lipoprotein
MSMRIGRSLCVGVVAGLVAAISGCTVGPNYQVPRTDVKTTWDNEAPATRPTTQPATTQTAAATRPSNVAVGESVEERWWSTFGDPELDRLVGDALQGSPDLSIAAARVREARAQRRFVAGAEKPSVEANGSYSVNRHAGPLDQVEPGDYNFYQAGFDASWEIDVFGGTRRAVESASAGLAAGIEESRAVRLSLLAEVARTYFELRAAQRRVEIARRNLATQERTLAITRERLAAGVNSDLDVSRAESLVASTRALLPALEDQAKQAMRRLGVLLGREPDALAEELSTPAPIPQPPARVAVGLPSELLRRRPDVRAAERRIETANALVGVATAELYPRFMLSGTIGQFDVNSLANFFNFDNRYFGIGPSFKWDVFNAGRTHARIDVEKARTDRALAEYRKTVLGALAEAQNALSAFNAEQDRRAALADAVAADRKAVDTASQLYRQGVAEFLAVLDAERSLAASEDALAQSDRAIGTNLIALFKALGGGWESTEPLPAAAAGGHGNAPGPRNG